MPGSAPAAAGGVDRCLRPIQLGWHFLLFTTALALGLYYGSVLWSGELQGFILHVT
jgi:hypothetical protein